MQKIAIEIEQYLASLTDQNKEAKTKQLINALCNEVFPGMQVQLMPIEMPQDGYEEVK